LWIITALIFTALQFQPHPGVAPRSGIIAAAVAMMLTGGAVAVGGVLILGWRRSLCLNFYEPATPVCSHRLFRLVRHPMDYGFWLLLMGFAWLTGSYYNLLVALTWIGLMIPHQVIENWPLKRFGIRRFSVDAHP